MSSGAAEALAMAMASDHRNCALRDELHKNSQALRMMSSVSSPAPFEVSLRVAAAGGRIERVGRSRAESVQARHGQEMEADGGVTGRTYSGRSSGYLPPRFR